MAPRLTNLAALLATLTGLLAAATTTSAAGLLFTLAAVLGLALAVFASTTAGQILKKRHFNCCGCCLCYNILLENYFFYFSKVFLNIRENKKNKKNNNKNKLNTK